MLDSVPNKWRKSLDAALVWMVISEVQQLGGAVSVVSEYGKRIHLRYAYPDGSGVWCVGGSCRRSLLCDTTGANRAWVRVNPEKLYDYYHSNAATLNFEDVDYRVRYLNEILSGNKLNELVVNTNTSLPLIIIKNRTGHHIALQVDQIAGSRIK